MASTRNREWWRSGVVFAGHILTAAALLLLVGWFGFLVTEGGLSFDSVHNPFVRMWARALIHFVLVFFALIFIVYVLREAWRIALRPAWKLLGALRVAVAARRAGKQKREDRAAAEGLEEGPFDEGLRFAGHLCSIFMAVVALGIAEKALSIATALLEHHNADILLLYVSYGLEDFLIAADSMVLVVFLLIGAWQFFTSRPTDAGGTSSGPAPE